MSFHRKAILVMICILIIIINNNNFSIVFSPQQMIQNATVYKTKFYFFLFYTYLYISISLKSNKESEYNRMIMIWTHLFRINIHKMLNTNRSERYQKLRVDYKAGMCPLWSDPEILSKHSTANSSFLQFLTRCFHSALCAEGYSLEVNRRDWDGHPEASGLCERSAVMNHRSKGKVMCGGVRVHLDRVFSVRCFCWLWACLRNTWALKRQYTQKWKSCHQLLSLK